MSVLIKHMAMPKGCIYVNDKDNTEYCPLLNYDDVPFCQYVEDEPEAAIGIDERPIYCPLEEQPEPCEDVVSKEAVSSWLKQYGQDVLHGKYKFSLMYIWKNLMDLPSVTPNQRWIPVSEKLPENRRYVLVTYKYVYGLIDHGITWYGEAEKKWDTSRNVIAWMPLPEPYKEGDMDE